MERLGVLKCIDYISYDNCVVLCIEDNDKYKEACKKLKKERKATISTLVVQGIKDSNDCLQIDPESKKRLDLYLGAGWNIYI